MDPPVTVVGCLSIQKDPRSLSILEERTFLVVPDTNRYIVSVRDQTRNVFIGHASFDFGPEFSERYFRTIVLPLSHVRDIVERELSKPIWATQVSWRLYLVALKAWRADLTRKQERALQILHKVKKTIASKRILNQFRMAIGNPSYRMCQKRLRMEFESLGDL
jgi:hypothetical protein